MCVAKKCLKMSVSDYFKFSHKHHCFIDNDKEVIKVNLHTKLFSELIDTFTILKKFDMDLTKI